MDTFQGWENDPVTLHKYAYGNLDPVNHTDPTGNFGLASISAANNIRSILANITVDIGLSLLDGMFSDDPSAGDAAKAIGIGAIGGIASFKLLRMLSSKFRAACNSFSGDTLVSTEQGLKPISGIEIGDKIWAFDEKTGEITLQDVVHLIQREGDKTIVDITLESGEVIQATAGHPFYVKDDNKWNWLDAGELSAGDILYGVDGETSTIKSIEISSINLPVYNLTVDNAHTYFVGEEGVLSHNAGKTCKFKGIVWGKEKDAIEVNEKHVPGKRGYNHSAGTLPPDADRAYKNNAVFDGKSWWAKGQNNALYRYCDNGRGVYHWCGSSKDPLAPMEIGRASCRERVSSPV